MPGPSGVPYLAFWGAAIAPAGQQIFCPFRRFGRKMLLDLIDARHRPA
jgi:hypothetical protein